MTRPGAERKELGQRSKTELESLFGNRDMWKGQCERQAEQLTARRHPEAQQ